MDDGRFDAGICVMGSDAPRRRVLAGLLAALPIALGSNQATAKKKIKCKGKKKCGGKCIPKTACCTDNDCDANEACTNNTCACTPDCAGRECGSDGCDGFCGPTGSCAFNEDCTPQGQCVCVPNCAGKGCGQDGCGAACKTCDSGETCNTQGQCCNSSGKCDCNRGYVCNGVVPFCDVQSNCACTSLLEGGTACGGPLCSLEELCQSTEFCVGKYGEGFVCQAPGTGCCGQRCVVPCGFTPARSAMGRAGATGGRQFKIGRNAGGTGSR